MELSNLLNKDRMRFNIKVQGFIKMNESMKVTRFDDTECKEYKSRRKHTSKHLSTIHQSSRGA